MATLTKAHGTAHGAPNFARALAGDAAVAITSPELVQLDGPQLDYFQVLLDSGSPIDLDTDLGPEGTVDTLMQLIHTKGTVAMYQVEEATPWQVSIGVYPVAAWTAASLQAAIRVGGPNGDGTAFGATSVDVSASTVTGVGFKLAAS